MLSYTTVTKIYYICDMNKWVAYIGVALLVVVIVVGLQNNHLKNKVYELEQSNNLLEASKDSMRKVYDDDSKSWQYERQSFKATNDQLEDYLKANEKDLYDLKKKYKAVVGVKSESELSIDTVVKTVIVKDTVSSVEVRTANIKNQWLDANVRSYPDSTQLKVKAYSYSSYAIDENGKLIVTEKNPYIQQKNINSFYVQPKKTKSKFWTGVAIGAGIVGGGILILK